MSENVYPSKSLAFISYSHKDAAALQELLIHLKPLQSKNLLDCWSDKDIRPGDKWNEEIEKSLQHAKVAILLVSPNYLASDFISNRELAAFLARSANKSLKILWIPISTSAYRQTEI